MINKNDILLIILTILILYILFEINNLKKSRENFDAATDTAINTAVKKIYLADVEAIRLLSNFAIQLSQGGFTVPGNVAISGKTNLQNTTNAKKINLESSEWEIDGVGWDKSCIVSDNKNYKALMITGNNSAGGNRRIQMYDDVLVTGKLDVPNAITNLGSLQVNGSTTLQNSEVKGTLTITGDFNSTKNSDEGGRILLSNTKKTLVGQTNTWAIYNMTGGYSNKLCFWRYNGDGTNKGPALDLYDDGNVRIYGNLMVDGKIQVGTIGNATTLESFASGFKIRAGTYGSSQDTARVWIENGTRTNLPSTHFTVTPAPFYG